jgi:hypothetical protein
MYTGPLVGAVWITMRHPDSPDRRHGSVSEDRSHPEAARARIVTTDARSPTAPWYVCACQPGCEEDRTLRAVLVGMLRERG